MTNEYHSDGPKESSIKQMRRFERLPVNLSASTILAPSGIDLTETEIKSAIQWSQHLDPIFANNLERDPSISWQYFGSSSGFLRRYPGTNWPPEGAQTNINDFRTEDWFVQSASSPKDIVSFSIDYVDIRLRLILSTITKITSFIIFDH